MVASPSTCPAASSTSRRCSPAPTRTRRSPRTSCSVRCSSCSPHDGDDDAVRIANNSIFGLSGAVVSGDRERALGVAAADPRRDDERQRRRLLRARRALRRLQAVGDRTRDGRGRAQRIPRAARRSPSRPVERAPLPRRPVGDREHRHARVARGDPPSRPRARRRAGVRPGQGRGRRRRALRRGAGRRRVRRPIRRRSASLGADCVFYMPRRLRHRRRRRAPRSRDEHRHDAR